MITLLLVLASSLAHAGSPVVTPLGQLRAQCEDHAGDPWLGLYRFRPEALVSPDGKHVPAETARRYAPFADVLVLGRSVDEYFAYLASPNGEYEGTGRKSFSLWYVDGQPRVNAYLYGSAPAFTNIEMRYGFSPTGKFEFRVTDHENERLLYSAPLTQKTCSDLPVLPISRR